MSVDGTELDVEQTLIRGGLFLTPDMQRISLHVLLSVGADILIQYVYVSVSQPPGRGPVPGPGINYTGPREA